MHSVRSISETRKRELHDRFIELSSLWSRMAKKEGLNVVPYFDSKLPHFSILDPTEQNRVLWQLETLIVVGRRLQNQGEKIRSGRALCWAFMQHMRYSAPSDLLAKMTDLDVVDAYSCGHKMIFANLKFFELLSYSIEDFFCRQWMDLFLRRDHRVHEMLVKVSEKLVAGQITELAPLTHIPTHLCEERDSPGRIQALVTPQFCAPIFHQAKIAGYIAAHRVVVLT